MSADDTIRALLEDVGFGAIHYGDSTLLMHCVSTAALLSAWGYPEIAVHSALLVPLLDFFIPDTAANRNRLSDIVGAEAVDLAAHLAGHSADELVIELCDSSPETEERLKLCAAWLAADLIADGAASATTYRENPSVRHFADAAREWLPEATHRMVVGRLGATNGDGPAARDHTGTSPSSVANVVASLDRILAAHSHVLDCGGIAAPTLRAAGHDVAILSQAEMPRSLPFRDRAFQAVCALNALERIDRRSHAAALREMRRVLEPRGFLLVCVPFDDDAGPGAPGTGHYHHELMLRLLIRTGFGLLGQIGAAEHAGCSTMFVLAEAA